MKYLLIALFISLPGCFNDDTKKVVDGVRKFEDGHVTCYVLFENAMSCVLNGL